MKWYLCLLLTIMSSAAYSASFDCAKAITSVEIMICENKELSALDSQLLRAYKKALNQTNVPNEIKRDQKEWLATERDACSDVACLKSQYQARLKLLLAVKPSSSNPDGEYEREDGNASITLKGADHDQFHITGNAVWIGNAEIGNVNTGNLDGFVTLTETNKLNYHDGDDEYACKLTITIGKHRLTVTDDNGYCGGVNVSFNGEYRKKYSE